MTNLFFGARVAFVGAARSGRASLPYSAFLRGLLCVALVMLGACSSSQQTATEGSGSDFQRYELRGKVVRLETGNRAAVIEHEEIVGWMEAMTMRFPVADEAEWNKLAVGEQITATVFVNDEGFHIGDIQVVAAAEPEEPAQPQGSQ